MRKRIFALPMSVIYLLVNVGPLDVLRALLPQPMRAIVPASGARDASAAQMCLSDVDGRDETRVSTDVVYIARHLLGEAPVPPEYRVVDPTIPSDVTIQANIEAARPALDVDERDGVRVSTDVVYIARHLLGDAPVPPEYRVVDPTIPPDETITAKIDALCSDTPVLLPLTHIESSPFNGERDVAVSRETIIRFSTPLAASAVVDDSMFFAESSGQRLSAQIHMSPDRRAVRLFYDNPLPTNARIQVTLIGNGLLDEQGRAIDANGDGTEGGTALIEFRTVSLITLPGTMVCGHVFASERGDGGANVPLVGVTVTVDGLESSLRTVTNQNGDFCLDPAPMSRFFAHIEGRTATNAVPEGAFYAPVGEALEPVPGERIDIGNIFLPLVAAGSLQPVSRTQDTTLTFPSSVLAQFPQYTGTHITVPADSLFADDGTRGGMVGIAPVTPDRLPGALPPGLEFPLVITVQTDGATNFDVPVPVCFPNLPDPALGQPLPPGEKNFLYSFNHDKGVWEAIGPMRVTSDGTLICTEPGVGIVAPGWHGSGPPPWRPPPPPPPPFCDKPTDPSKLAECTLNAADKYGQENKRCWDIIKGCFPIPRSPNCIFTLFRYEKCYFDALVDLYEDVQVCRENFCDLGPASPKNSLSTIAEQANQSSPLEEQLFSLAEQIALALYPFTMSGEEIPQEVQDQVDDLLAQANALVGGDAVDFMRNLVLASEEDLALLESELGSQDGNAPPYPIMFLAEFLTPSGALQLRGETEPFGQYSLFVPRGSVASYIIFYDPRTNKFGTALPTRSPNAEYPIRRLTLTSVGDDFPDFDNDELFDLVELVYGTDTANPDTDGDGVSDGVEVQRGTDPLDGKEDFDDDGLTNSQEILLGTDPAKPDTDGDGISDGAEVSAGTNPLDIDTDDDGFPDGLEVTLGSDPLDKNSIPVVNPFAIIVLEASGRGVSVANRVQPPDFDPGEAEAEPFSLNNILAP